MQTELEIRLAEFVDRDAEMKRFCDMFECSGKAIMFISGEGGYGKSSLLARMIHECAAKHLRKSEITWTETQNHDYLGIMRKIRDDVGPQYFQGFTTLVNQFTDPSVRITIAANTANINVAQGLTAENSSIGDIGAIIVKDSMFVIPKGDRSVPESERMIPLTNAFLDNLATAANAMGPLVIFFDAVEKMTQETAKWVLGELLRAVQTGALPKVYFVHCGRQKPDVDRYMGSVVEEAELGPLGQKDIALYLEKRGIEQESRLPFSELLLTITKGNPLQIANYMDALLKRRTKLHQ